MWVLHSLDLHYTADTAGKSTMAVYIAYKWVKPDLQYPLCKFSVVFVININEVQDSNASLTDLILEQIHPEDSSTAY